MTLEALGIGDLHLDGKLGKYVPDLNKVIIGELRKAVRYAEKNAISTIFLYGDICDGAVLSAEAHIQLTSVIVSHPHIHFVMIKGNHDVMDSEVCSLDYLKFLSDSNTIKNLTIALTPMMLFKDTDAAVNLLPWPHADTRVDCLNVMHTEAAGTTWETGRQVTSGFNTNHLCVVGHIHKAQRVRNSYFSGTLYQISFGEPVDKFFHHIKWTGKIKTSSVELIPHKPKYTLINKIINKVSDIEDIENDPTTLYKIFVKKSVILPEGVFNNKPNIVKTRDFANKTELKALVLEELVLDDISFITDMDHGKILDDWLVQNQIENSLAKRVKEKFETFQQRISA